MYLSILTREAQSDLEWLLVVGDGDALLITAHEYYHLLPVVREVLAHDFEALRRSSLRHHVARAMHSREAEARAGRAGEVRREAGCLLVDEHRPPRLRDLVVHVPTLNF